MPIAGVNWHDAKAYAVWMSRTTGLTYRLPTDQEWTFAAAESAQAEPAPLIDPSDPAQAWIARYEAEAARAGSVALAPQPVDRGSVHAHDREHGAVRGVVARREAGDEPVEVLVRCIAAHEDHALAQQPNDRNFSIEGFTDSSGSERENQMLSEKRAQAVADRLTEAGIDASRIRSTWQPVGDPAADMATEGGRSLSRRVEVELYHSAPRHVSLSAPLALGDS